MGLANARFGKNKSSASNRKTIPVAVIMQWMKRIKSAPQHMGEKTSVNTDRRQRRHRMATALESRLGRNGGDGGRLAYLLFQRFIHRAT